MKFLCLFVFLGIFLVQGTYSAPQNERIDWQGIYDEVKKWFQDKLNTAKQVVDDALKTIAEKWESLKKLISDVTGDFVAKVNKIFEDLKEQIEKLVHDAQEQGVEVGECIKNEKDDILALGKESLDMVVNCTKVQSNDVERLIENVKRDINEIWEIIKNMPSQLSECIKDPSWQCFYSVIEEFTTFAKKAYEHWGQDVIDVTNIVAQMKPRLEMCSMKGLAHAAVNSGHILSDIKICIQNQKTEYLIRKYKYHL